MPTLSSNYIFIQVNTIYKIKKKKKKKKKKTSLACIVNNKVIYH